MFNNSLLDRPVIAAGIFSADQVTQRILYSRSQLQRLSASGSLPGPIRITPRRVGWFAADVFSWMQDRINERAEYAPHANMRLVNANDRFIGHRAVCKLVCLSRETIRKLEAEKSFPARIRIGNRRVAWLEAEVISWIADRHPNAS